MVRLGVPTMRTHEKLRIACLVTALLITCLLATLLSPLISDRYVEAFPGEGVTVTYIRNPAFLASNLPLIRVEDLSGGRIDAVIINLFAVMPNAKVRFIGSAGSSGSTLLIPRQVITKFTEEAIPAWRNKLGSIKGFKTSLLAFINIIRKTSSGNYVTYPYVTTIPLNPSILSKGYTLNSITITLNTKSVKPSVIKPANLPRVANTNVAVRPKTNLNLQSTLNTLGPNCVLVYGRPENFVYCVEWRLEKEYAHLEDTLIPVMALRIPYGYYTDPRAIFNTYLSFDFQESTSAYFKLYAGIKLSNALQVSYESVETLEDFSFTYDKEFFNSRWTAEKPSFTDDALIIVGFKGSATLGLFREYEALCNSGSRQCPEDDYVPTDTTANITLMDIDVMYDGQHWVATTYDYNIDDTVGNGKGWDQFWSFAMEHAQPEGTSAGVGEATYRYLGNTNNEVYIAIDIADLIAMLVKNPKLSSCFPVNAGISLGAKSTSIEIAKVHVLNENQYLDYYIYIDSYKSRDEVYIDGTHTHLKLMLFDVEDYSPW